MQFRLIICPCFQASGSHLLAIAVLQGMAAGTLLYVTFYEVTKTIITFENIVITKIITDTSLLVHYH